MNDDFQNKLDSIRDAMKKECNYLKAINLCKNNLKIVDKNLIEELCILNHNLALCYKKIGKIDDAIKYAIISLNYSEKYIHRKTTNLWLLATLYEIDNNNKKAREMYLRCAIEYRQLKDNVYKSCMLFNVAKLKNNIGNMIRIAHNFEKINDYDNITTYDEIDKNNFIIEMYTNIIDYYINYNENEKNIKIINDIQNINLKNTMLKNLHKKISA